ncbi:MAG: DNA-3-methyladenine glycosylase I [Vicinamibacteria bacterium]|nr:DNA-3-methyladenine glycosylase I [Vicinamibacteria bacterium]
MSRRVTRCGWAETSPEMRAYHDKEWGVPVHDDRTHFEFLILDGAQAGLSWATILKRREAYRRAFAGFDPERVARFTARDERRLADDAGIVRNRRKIAAAIRNARCFLAVRREHGSFDSYLWSFVGGRPIVNHRRSLREIPPRTPLSDRISRDLVGRGFTFAGSIIVYAHMQAVGLVNDHLVSCFRHREVGRSERDVPLNG